MIGMRYALDVVFLDEACRVVHIVPELRPGAVSPKVANATSVVELPSGTIARTGLARGTRLAIEGANTGAASGTIATLACNVFLAAFYFAFAAAHVRVGQRTGDWLTVLPVVFQETLLVALFLTRRRSLATSTRAGDWAIGILATLLPLFMRPTASPGPLASIGRPIQVLGLVFVIAAVSSLGRSIGIVAGNRGVQTRAAYRVVRHPMYGAHMIAYVGYVLCYPSARTVLIVAATIVALCMRAVIEERFLDEDPKYHEYLARTRWRFVPFVY